MAPMRPDGGECVVNNNKTGDAGFRWRRNDGTQAGGLLRDIAMALAVTLALALAGMIGAAHAQEHIVQISGAHRTAMVTVSIGKSRDVRTDRSFVDVTVGDPEVADVNPLTDHSLSILAKKIGTTRVSVYAEGKKLIGIFDVEVTYDLTRLTNELVRNFPGSALRASSVNGRIMLSGDVMDAATLDKAVTIARQFGPEIINTVTVMSPQQVHAGSALHRIVAHRRPRARRAVEPGRRQLRSPTSATAWGPQPADHRVGFRARLWHGSRRRRALGRHPVRVHDRAPGRERRLHRRDDQCARAEGHRTQSRRAEPRGAVRATPQASSPAASIRSRCPARSVRSPSTTRNTASAWPSRRPCSAAA